MIEREDLDLQTLAIRLHRIYRLSEKPVDPGYAYRHLEHIHALAEAILEEVEGQPPARPEGRPVEIRSKAHQDVFLTMH